MDPVALTHEPATVRYQKRTVGRDDVTDLLADPTLPIPLPLWRIGANSIATFALVLTAGLIIAATAPRLLGFGAVVVTSGSMEPAIRSADVVITSPSDGKDLAANAVINFDHDGSMRLHRIESVTPEGYRTSGDANPSPDSDLVQADQIEGVGTMVVPFVGLPSTWWNREEWLPLALTLLALVAACYMSRARWVDAKTDPLRS